MVLVGSEVHPFTAPACPAVCWLTQCCDNPGLNDRRALRDSGREVDIELGFFLGPAVVVI